ncbi:hypothetical protein NKW84_10630 [Acetobacter senegalensis]|uniref:hypothetical protein n=1 Tax=Acetobacter senegalensis TaxID=446692 RepID=UPI0020A0327F|nr:hypothetical protein [Acetobacter senegalensis]MCP1196314.1 hypothetical protein [Acetobacter senegalensis]
MISEPAHSLFTRPAPRHLLNSGFWLLAFGFWLLAFGFWLLAFGFWLLAFGCTTHDPTSVPNEKKRVVHIICTTRFSFNLSQTRA